MICFAVGSAILALGGVAATVTDFHMLQQNSYYISRYFRWWKGNACRYFSRWIWLVLLLICSICRWAFLSVSIVYAVAQILLARSAQKKAIKPLVVTARVQRMFVTESVLLLACAIGATVLWPLRIVLVILSAWTPLIAVAVIVVNAPMESLVRRHYYNDAKRILRRHKPMTVIGITGSFGKTSTKYALSSILQEKYNVCFTPGNFNTTLGVVRTIREQLKSTDDVFIVEMGAKNVGDIKEICDLVQPNLGIITSVGEQHLETFGSLDNVRKTKFELADAVNRNGGKIYLNMDCPAEADYAASYSYVGYGKAATHVRLQVGKSDRFGSSFTVTRGDTSLLLQTKLLGLHNMQNLVGAVAVAMDLGVLERDIRFAVNKLTPVAHRLEMKPFLNGSLLLDDAYNANPSGCLEAVRVLSSFDGCRKIIVTPGLVELGEREDVCNADLGEAAMDVCDRLVFVGLKRSEPLMSGAKRSARFNETKITVVSSFREAMAAISDELNAQCVVLFENDLPDNYTK